MKLKRVRAKLPRPFGKTEDGYIILLDKIFIGLVWKDKDYPEEYRWQWTSPLPLGEVPIWGGSMSLESAMYDLKEVYEDY